MDDVRGAGVAVPGLSHLDENGRPRMVDVGDKPETRRRAVARGRVYMKRETLEIIRSGGGAKGDVLSVAQTAGVMAAKDTARAIPMCHNIFLEDVGMRLDLDAELCAVRIEADVRTTGKTGVEMEAMHAVSVAALTIYDMCKAADRGMRISDIRLYRKEGGKSGLYECEES
ncbi:MAG: cyclic pyranopterin monophosphate synthase MoaC [Clostridiales Family XIII bacterium]|jgi:cyclic pyranopterin phosphate synthase|nr:cyclic pyranopterin monophosphate synthase MoaC [Clostridiales Family XIII bacterium]